MNNIERDILVKFPTCKTQVASYRAERQMIKEPLFVKYVASVMIVYSVFGMLEMQSIYIASALFALMAFCSLFYFSGHLAFVAGLLLFTPSARPVVYYSIIGTIFSASLSTALYVYLAEFMDIIVIYESQTKFEVIALRTAQLVVFEWVFHTFVFPKLVLSSNRGRAIKFGDHEIDIDDILYFQALEHHVKLVTRSRDIVERSRLKHCIQLLADVDGIQPHRSYWVAKQAIRGTKVTSNTLVLITDKGDIPVAGTRRDEVENWLITHEFVIEH